MSSEYDRRSRALDTKMQGFHQIVALSQDLINASLWSLWSDEEKEDQLAKFSVTLDDDYGVSMSGRMGPPTVELFADVNYEDHPPVVYFIFNLESGQFDYFSGNGPKAKKKTAEMGKWKLLFKVDLSLDKLSTVPQDVQEKIRVPGQYSVNQLLLDFGEPETIRFDRSRSYTPGLTLFDKEYFLDALFQRFIARMKKEKKTVLGYAVTVADPKVANPQAPTFPPTLVKFQTMCYKPEHERTGPSGNDSFIFLEMTGENPSFPDGPLRMSGNWVVPGVNGTMAICKANFWDRYLLPQLKSFNGAVLDLVNRLKVCAEKGDRLRNDERFDWSCTDDPRPSNDTLSWSTAEHGAYFRKSLKLYGAEPQYFTEVETSVQWDPGYGKIKLIVRIQMEEQKLQFNSVYKTTVFVYREVNLTLTSVLDGGLEVHVSEEQPKVGADGHKRYLFWDLDSGKVPERMKQHVEARMVSESMSQGIKEALNGQRHFVFPGGGTFVMKDPIFNEEGDLLIGLNYKAGQ